MAKPGDKGFCTTKCEYKDTTQGWVCETHVCVEEAVLAVTVQESGSSSRIINIPLKKGTTTTAGGAILRFSTTTGDTDDLNDVAVSGGILPAAYKIMVGNDRKLNVFLKSEPTKPITEYIDELTKAKTASNSTVANARKNADGAKAALKEAQDNYAAAQKESADARVAAAKAQAEAAAATTAQAALTANVTRLTGNVAAAQGTSAQARAEAAAAAASLAAIEAQITILEDAVAAARSNEQDARDAERNAIEELAEARLEHAQDLAIKQAELNAELARTRESLATEQATLAAAQASVQRLTDELAAAPTAADKATVDAQLEAAKADITRLTDTVAEKQQEIGTHTAELQQVRDELATAKEEAATELAETKETAHTALRTVNQQLADIRTEKAAADAKLQTITEQSASITAELAAARANAATSAEARSQLAAAEQHMVDVQRELVEAKARADAALAQERAARDTVAETQRETGERIAAAEKAIKDQMAALSHEKGQFEGLSLEKQATIDRLTADLTAARERERGITTETAALQERIRAAQATAEADRLAANAAAAKVTGEQRARVNAEAAQAAAAKDAEIRGLREGLARLERDRAAVDASLRAAQAKAGAAEATVARLTTPSRDTVDAGAKLRAKDGELMAVRRELEEVKASSAQFEAAVSANLSKIKDLTDAQNKRSRETIEGQASMMQSLRALLAYIVDILLQQKGGGRGIPAKKDIIGYLGSPATIDSFKQVITSLLDLPATPLKFGGGLKNRTVKKRRKNK